MAESCRHPDLNAHLSTGCDGDTGAITARVTASLRRGGYASEQGEFRQEVFAAESYGQVLRICMRWVNVT